VPRYGLIDRDYGLRLRSVAYDGDGRIYMLNLTKFLPGSDLLPGTDRLGNGASRDADEYAPIPLLTAVGARLRLVSDVVASSGDWDQVTVVDYPTRRSFLELAERRDFREWHMHKQAAVERTTVVGMLPAQDPPGDPAGGRILLELWHGPTPLPLAAGPATSFDVEGTVIGDGRNWSGARYTAIETGTPLPLQRPRPDYQALLLEPRIARWR
jgi:hypothetical protein